MKTKQASHHGSPAEVASIPNLSSRPAMQLLASFTVALATCGCQVLTYTSPSGETFSRTTLGVTTAIASLEIQAQTNGIRRVELKGYQNDSTRSLQAVTEAAVRAAVQGAR